MNIFGSLIKNKYTFLILELANVVISLLLFSIYDAKFDGGHLILETAKDSFFIVVFIVFATFTIIITIGLHMYELNIINSRNYNKLKLSFICIMSISVILMIIVGYFTKGESIRSMLHYSKTDFFMDYFNSIQYGMEPYGNKVIYPPLINVLYGGLGGFFVKDGLTPLQYRTDQLSVTIFFVYSIISYYLLYFSVNRFSSDLCNGFESKLLFALLFFSLPFLYLLERGNSLILALSFLVLFCSCYYSCDRHTQIMAMIALSIATSIKIIPCVFGLLYLRDRNIHGAIKCMVIGILIFNIPFVFTDGDVFSLINNIKNTTQIFQGYVEDKFGVVRFWGNGQYVNLDNTITTLNRLLNVDLSFVGKFLKIIVFIYSTIIVVFMKKAEKWQVFALLCGIIVLLPGFSAIYNLSYYTIPLICFLGSKPKIIWLNSLYLMLFILIFMPIINVDISIFGRISGSDVYPLRLSTMVESFSVLLLSVVVIIDVFTKELRNVVS